MKAKQFQEILRSVTYKTGYKISGQADDESGMGIVFVDARVTRAVGGGRFQQRWMSSWHDLRPLTTRYVQRLVLNTIRDMEDHERRERLRFGKLRPFNPHGGR